MDYARSSFCLSDIKSIVIFRALLLGDLLCAGPAFLSLRAAMPQARITLVSLPWARALRSYMPGCFDDFIEFPGYPGFPERKMDPTRLPGFLREVQEQKYDLALQMQGNGYIANSLVAAFGARRTGGYYLPGQYCPDRELCMVYPEKLPEIWRHLALMRHLGVTVNNDRLHFHVPEEDSQALRELLKAHRIEQPYVCIHPGTNAEWRCWPVEHYAAVADILAAEGFQVVVTGSAAERERAQHVLEYMHSPAINLAGETTNLGVLGALIRDASLTVCGDTGISHLACAVDCPSVVVFMRSETEGWPPLDRIRHRLVCSISGVTEQMVIEEALDLLHLARAPYSGPATGISAISIFHQASI
ncbi:LPS biosynthesis glycosyltransferase [Verrucomicrobia bacterium LW23]|nr:LPS biosynthesis glycosyltransferase [Verrucomicrobia bacterium LW23]